MKGVKMGTFLPYRITERTRHRGKAWNIVPLQPTLASQCRRLGRFGHIIEPYAMPDAYGAPTIAVLLWFGATPLLTDIIASKSILTTCAWVAD